MESATGGRGLIDTDVLIDALRGSGQSKRFLFEQHTQGGIQISVVSAMELIQGCRNAAERNSLLKSMSTWNVLPIGPSASLKAYEWMLSFSLSHGLEIPDALIAGTAAERNLVLFTRNTRHFQMISEVTLEQPY